ncbi:MAG: MTH1187 family thiamine-binding protein [Candidatus Bipolaricaulis sp.]|nr:MTH1187 family thiamine-binding protein [Candidatus Bipolaricaulis sp.]MDD5265333.1 MTH1187 family thiamine-binding protein [Candidatus Bipolaricaulis sp.]
MIVDFSIAPIGRGESLSAHIADAYRIIEASGLSHEFHAMGTNLEGEWEEVMSVVNACRLRLLETCGRVSISLRIDDRKGPHGRLDRKVASARGKAGL